MDFNKNLDEQQGANKGKADMQVNKDANVKSQSGTPVRWDFKAILKQQENRNNTEVSSTTEVQANSVKTETTGDAEFDRQWAEMMSKEETEKQAKFVADNQIKETTESKTETQPVPSLRPRIKSVAEIMRGFGNPGTDDEENALTEESTTVPAAITSPVENVTAVEENNIESAPEVVAEVTPEVVAETTLEVIAETTPEVIEEATPEVVAEVTPEVVAETIQETIAETTLEVIAETSQEVIAETTPKVVAEVTQEVVAEITPEVIAETAPEVVSETEEVIGEAIPESLTEWTPELTTEFSTQEVTELNTQTVAETSDLWSSMNENISEPVTDEMSVSPREDTVVPIESIDFVPIELATEPELPSENTMPVFVNVEHSWMYAEEIQQEAAEPIVETNFENALPGELPLFESGSNQEITSLTGTHTHNNPKSEEAMKFELPEYSSIIKVIGVGGGGSNAVNHMYKAGIKGVDFLVCNTDKQALDLSPVPHKLVLGTTLTEGRGAGSIPEVGRNAAIENIEDLRTILSNNTKMVFITAGMGGGTGTGAAPVIAGVARELGILTVGIVTVPFAHEGKKRRQYAEEGIEMLKQNVDTLLVIRNDKLREMYGNLKLSDAFAHADDVLTTAAKSIAEIISLTQQINVDFADICTVMRNSGVAIMGSAIASGENRAVRAVEMSLNSPLLNDNNIIGARYVLLNIISGADEITMDELGEITDFIQEAAGQTAEIIKGYGVDPSLGDSVSVTIIATGFQQTNPVNYEYAPKSQPEKVVRQLEEKPVTEMPKVETPKAETESETNPLEPFLVSKPSEPVAESKTDWTSSSTVEFEIVNTSEEITEATNEPAASNEEIVNEATPATENTAEEIAEPVLIKKDEVQAEVDAIEASKKAEQEEIQRRANERIQKLREISMKLKSPQVLNEMENEPAYKRRNVNLENIPHSSESQVSRFTLTETEDKKIEIRPNNSFLHDNVD